MNQMQLDGMWRHGSAYELYVGRWSRLAAAAFLNWLQPPPEWTWLDVGCGTGALCDAILLWAAPRYVVGTDASYGYVEYARRQITASNTYFQVGDARQLSFPDKSYDALVSGLALNFVPDPDRAILEMARVVRAGGKVAAYVWDYAGEMQFIRYFWNAARELDPAANELDEGERFGICRPEPLESLFKRAGLNEIDIRAIDVPTRFLNFDEYWSPFLGGQGPAPSYVMLLTGEGRVALRERIRAQLPQAADGSIHLIARAWAVRGTCS